MFVFFFPIEYSTVESLYDSEGGFLYNQLLQICGTNYMVSP